MKYLIKEYKNNTKNLTKHSKSSEGPFESHANMLTSLLLCTMGTLHMIFIMIQVSVPLSAACRL